MAKKIFITGAGGYIGSRMVETYLGLGYEIVAFDRFFFGDILDDLKVNKNLKIVKDDTRFFKKNLLKEVDIVIDLAALSNDATANLDPKITRDINYRGSVRVAKLSKEMGVKKYIFASSCSVYGTGKTFLNEESSLAPISEYAKCKILTEKETLKLSSNDFCVTHLRNSTVFGLSKRRMRFDLIVNIMTLNACKNNKVFILGGGRQWRPLIHIDDCIRAFLMMVEEDDIKKINGQIFNVGSSDQNFQTYQVALKLKKYFPNITFQEVPGNLEKRNYRVDFTKIKKAINFKTKKSVESGIEEILAALKSGEVIDKLSTHTLQYYQYLIDTDKFISSIKINGALFK